MTNREDDLLAALGELTGEIRHLRAEVARLRDVNAPAEPTPALAPIYVAEAAGLLGVSRETLDRVIRNLPEDRRPSFVPPARAKPGARAWRRYFWPDGDALRAWWTSVSTPADVAPKKPTRTRKGPAPDSAVTDWRGLVRGLKVNRDR